LKIEICGQVFTKLIFSGNSDGINCPVAAGTAITTALTLTIDAPVTGVLAGLLLFFFLIKASLNKRFK
jgi:hypothetical protein